MASKIDAKLELDKLLSTSILYKEGGKYWGETRTLALSDSKQNATI